MHSVKYWSARPARQEAGSEQIRAEAAQKRITRSNFLIGAIAAGASVLVGKDTLGGIDKAVFDKRQKRGLFAYFGDFNTYNGGMSFDKAFSNMEYAGFNVVLPEVITSEGRANYRTSLYPENQDTLSRVGEGRDPLRELIGSAEKHGIHVWPWVPLFRVGREGELYKEEMRREREGHEKLQPLFAVSAYGRRSNFLNFLNNETWDYQIDAILQLVKNYRIQGINLDIELPTDHISYSEGDKKAFMSENGIARIESWPNDVLGGGRHEELWLRWANKKIAKFLERLSREVRRIDGDFVISYDVTRIPNYSGYYSDWTLWDAKAAPNIMGTMLYQWDSHLGQGAVNVIAERDRGLVMRSRRGTELIIVVGGSLEAMKGVSGNELALSVKDAMRDNHDRGVMIFCYQNVDDSDAWRNMRQIFRK